MSVLASRYKNTTVEIPVKHHGSSADIKHQEALSGSAQDNSPSSKSLHSRTQISSFSNPLKSLHTNVTEPKYVALILAYVAAAMASPTSKPNSTDFVEHYREPAQFSNGTLIWYGASEDTSASEIEQRAARCSVTGDAPKCSSSHNARNGVCDSLVTELYGDGSTTVPKSPRQICYRGDSDDDEFCCVSWHNPVDGLTKDDLAVPANKIMAQCTESGISGKIFNIYLRSTCSAVCLSSRGKGC